MPKVVTKGNKKQSVVNKSPETDQWEIIHAIAFWGLAILLFLPSYFRGLFFQPEQERALVFAAIIFWLAWLWKWSKRDYSFISHPMDYFVLGFPVVYLISAFQAANYGLAVDEVVKTTLYFLVYWLASRLVRDEKDITTILHVIYISAIGIALAGLATATGAIHIQDGYIDGRIYSCFQYPNALASYLAAVTFIGLFFWRKIRLLEPDSNSSTIKSVFPGLNSNSLYQLLYTAGNFILLLVLFGTKSRGGFLVFALVYILFIIGLPKGNKLPIVAYSILLFIPSFIVMRQFLSFVAVNKMVEAWLWVLAGLALVMAEQALYNLSERKILLQRFWVRKSFVQGVVIILIVAVCIVTGAYIDAKGHDFTSLIEKVIHNSDFDRMYYIFDAMKMFKDRPILGWSGGGWQEAYHAYQSFMYNSNQVHGHYFQIMVETGLLGLLVILGIWFSFLAAAHRVYHKAKDDRVRCQLSWVLTVVALSIGLHAAFDFDLSLSALALVLWTIFGLVRFLVGVQSHLEEQKKNRQKSFVPLNIAPLVAITIFSFTIIFFTGSLAYADNCYRQSMQYLQKQNVVKGIDLLLKASSYNPFNADYHSILSGIYQQTGKPDQSLIEAQKAVRISRYNAKRYMELSARLCSMKKNEDAVAYAEKALTQAPFQIQNYEFLAKTYLFVGYNELIDGNNIAASHYLENALSVPNRIQEQLAALNETQTKIWREAPLITPTPAVKLAIGSAQYLLGRWNEADENLQVSLTDEGAKGEAALWLALLRDKQGQAQEAQQLLEQAQKFAPELAKGYEGLRKIRIINS